MKTYLFYDIETSGLSPAFDQVLTFACIRTDLSMTELSREVITINLRPDVIPSPQAFLTHCLTPEELEGGMPEYQAALKIHALFNTPGTISCGYNSLGFDDEFLRFLFYRNLLDPYSHQFANGCSRMDMLPVATIFRLFCPNVLLWPSLPDGSPTLKLEFLSEKNNFEVSGRAHEAMADVEALLSLARIFAGEKKIWDYVIGFFDKIEDDRRMRALSRNIRVENDDFSIGLMVSVSFGSKIGYIAPVVHLGGSSPYKNQSLWLRLDKEGLFDDTDDENGIYDIFVIRKRPGDQFILLPCLERFWKRLAPDAETAFEKNTRVIANDPGLFIKTAAYHRAYRYPEIPDVDPDAALYQSGFFSAKEKQEMRRFHAQEESQKFLVSDDFTSPRIRTLAHRILARSFDYAPEKIPEFEAHMSRLAAENPDDPVKGYKGDVKFTCKQALSELVRIESDGVETLEPVQKKILSWLKLHISGMSASFADTL